LYEKYTLRKKSKKIKFKIFRERHSDEENDIFENNSITKEYNNSLTILETKRPQTTINEKISCINDQDTNKENKNTGNK